MISGKDAPAVEFRGFCAYRPLPVPNPAARNLAMPTATEHAADVSGRPLTKGDTVSSLNGQMTGKVWEVQRDDGEAFVSVRPLHQPYAPATWYAADQLIWVATPGAGKSSGGSSESKPGQKPSSNAKTTVQTTSASEKTAEAKPKKKK